MFIPNQDLSTDRILVEFKSIEKLEEQLKYVLLLLYSLDAKGLDKFRDEILEFESIFSNTNFMRQVKERDGLISEYPVEYYGKDYGDDDPFKYKKELEIKINKITLKLMATLGLVVKYLKEQNIVIDDET